MKKTAIEPGQVYVAPFPFVTEEYHGHDEEGPYTDLSWKPGTRPGAHGPQGEQDRVADGEGEIILTVVSTHKPGAGYQERVFYIRQWRDPNGKTFGKNTLRVTSAGAFRRMAAGYRHDYTTSSKEAAA